MNRHTELVISQTDPRPMYQQIMEQIRHKIMLGDWAPGMEMPSIRQLAIDLQVSVITVKRAYGDLEAEGVIVTQQGRGSFVSARNTPETARIEEELHQHLQQAAKLAEVLGHTEQDLMHQLRQHLRLLKKEQA
ncbi:GntR family transcriptional regulator [Deinococcus cellulosilyticus]|uniref:GntR family transcriptional regulator n=1 Tax=Deinococcus cellulosilyticus (strain DSM 18568 / NBRC 106333 / KACC 11606 / 5516J-15) TaxID=1223518 RepID=A0A511MZJ0_DEIC1|nr:GntR family transcriptional regulator [Deinococcus cellulosilyticus]GEM46003.1 GntR family transcriptional regulator [Deinococcus cellulosilyticus NBRC 106333 = KACC 11606]